MGIFSSSGSRDVVSTEYQGGTQQNPVDILGDVILILDRNMQLQWAWDTFAHQALSRRQRSTTYAPTCSEAVRLSVSNSPRLTIRFMPTRCS